MLKLSIAILTVVFFLTGCTKNNLATPLTHNIEKKEGIYSVKQAKEISIEELVGEVEHYPIIFVGDHHNTKKTHKFFENFLQRLDKKGYNLNLANEWFTPNHNELLKMYTDGKIDGIRLKERRHWDEFTSFKWEYVEPLYEAVKKNSGRLYGMNIPKKDRKKISLKQFDKMTKEEKEFYDSLDLSVSAHRQLVMPYLKHCNKMPQRSEEACEERMYRVQVSWDTYMANRVKELANKVLKTSKDKLLVFVGAMHVEQNVGIPLRFARQSNLPYVIISNEQIQKEKALKIDNNKADFVFVYKKD